MTGKRRRRRNWEWVNGKKKEMESHMEVKGSFKEKGIGRTREGEDWG